MKEIELDPTQIKVLEKLKAKAAEEPTYQNENKVLQTQYRYITSATNQQHFRAIRDLQEEHKIPPKEKATKEELFTMVGMVLETGRNGTKTIREFAKNNNKSEKWVKDVAKNHQKKLIDTVLNEYEENEVILLMKKNKVYDAREIRNKSITGALSKLAKQWAMSKEKEDNKKEKQELQNKLRLKKCLSKESKINWQVAQELRASGMTVRAVAEIVGASASGVSKYAKPKKPDV